MEVGLGVGELEESGAGGAKRAKVKGMGSGEGSPPPHELLHVSPPGFAPRHRLLPLDPGMPTTHLLLRVRLFQEERRLLFPPSASSSTDPKSLFRPLEHKGGSFFPLCEKIYSFLLPLASILGLLKQISTP